LLSKPLFKGGFISICVINDMKFFNKPKTKRATNSPSGLVIDEYPMMILPPGIPAPDFSLPSSKGDRLSWRDFLGQPVILAFYPADWSPVCGDQMVLYNEVVTMFEAYGAQLLGISVDGIWSHKAFAESHGLTFPLLADFEPKGEVAKRYGVYNATEGTSQRALFVIDSQGIIRWSYVSPPGVNPGADGILAALESLN
jgi:peroxiredoxin